MKHKTYTTITGLTQEEIAMWLCIPRSQWSMYESGKRSLPQKSVAYLAKLLQELKHNKKRSDETVALQVNEEKKMMANFENEIKNVALEILHLQRTIISMEAKRNKCLAALDVAFFIENNPKNDSPKDLALSIKNRCVKTLEKYPLSELERLKLKAESLYLVKEMMAQKIKKHEVNSPI